MDINKCLKCNEYPRLVTNSAIEYDDLDDKGVPIKHHFHDIPVSYLECGCGQTISRPLSDRPILVADWNAKNPDPTPAVPELPIANKA